MKKEYKIHGNKPDHCKARKVLPILVRQAKARRGIYYDSLGRELGIYRRHFSNSLDIIADTIDQMNARSSEKQIPYINSLVIEKETGLPAGGIDRILGEDLEKMSAEDRKNRLLEEKDKVFRFDAWDDVLDKLFLQKALSGATRIKILEALERVSKIGDKGAGGEGEEHEKLKAFIKDNPKEIGLQGKLKATVEYQLPSGDSIDVFFENSKHWYGVEVKSVISSENDIFRGIYQCVKYQAVMEAKMVFEKRQKKIEVILALGRALSSDHILVKNTLGVIVIENVIAQKNSL